MQEQAPDIANKSRATKLILSQLNPTLCSRYLLVSPLRRCENFLCSTSRVRTPP